jgi:hypothetical protein
MRVGEKKYRLFISSLSQISRVDLFHLTWPAKNCFPKSILSLNLTIQPKICVASRTKWSKLPKNLNKVHDIHQSN